MRLRDTWRPWASRRVAKCGRVRIAEAVGIATRDGSAHYHGLMRCASAWECPHCQTVLRIARATEVRTVVEWHAENHGDANINLITLTVRHGMGDDLKTIRRGVTRSYSKLQAGKQWQTWRARLGVVGYLRALEITHGANGWHPHIHAVLLTRVPPTPEFIAWIKERWARIVERDLGAQHVPTYARGVDVRECHAADYLSKLGLEVTAPSKLGRAGNRVPLQILADAATGNDIDSLNLYRVYARALKGARMLTWSRGLKRAAGIVEQSDAEVIEGEDAPEQYVAVLAGATWDCVRDIPNMPARLLLAAEQGGRAEVLRILAACVEWPPGYELGDLIPYNEGET